MRPEKAKQIINRTILRYLDDEPTSMYLPDMIRALNTMYCKQAIWHKDHGYEFNDDYTPDLDTDYKNIENEMFYISDRWNNPQRLSWIIFGIEENKF